MSGWLLESIEIEGLRGINNEGAPLVIRFKANCITSISAPNGVGKSSIFDAMSFAIRGTIPKLDSLPASENAGRYYVNRFHTLGAGHITLTLVPYTGGRPIAIRVACTADGTRTVSGPPGVDANAILAQLDREFVLLDNKTFQSFIDDKDLDRGRSFAGLLGLRKFSDFRQTLQSLARTQPFNNHFGTQALEQRQRSAATNLQAARRGAATAFLAVTKKNLADYATPAEAEAAAHASLEQIELLKAHCVGKSFNAVDLQACLGAITQAESGQEREKLARLIRQQAELEAVIGADALADADRDVLRALAGKRDQALSEVGSALLRRHFIAAERVLSDAAWPDKKVCPTCDTVNDQSVLDKVNASLGRYQAVQDLAAEISGAWDARNFGCLSNLEKSAKQEGEPTMIADAVVGMGDHSLTAAQIDAIWAHRTTCRDRLAATLETVRAERAELERKLPPSYVEVTKSVEAARQLAENWTAAATAGREIATVAATKARIEKIKQFLDGAATSFAGSESRAAARRLAAVEPVCRTFFAAIIHAPVQPALLKPTGSETLALSLSQFWSLQDVSAQALLSESFRNAFAVSVYLAAAQLYGGDARFILLDDVTSSFDAGHQFHIMEVIRTQFARPGQANGPQVIILSHDTLLEKLFNKNSNGADWQHVRLEGTARTAVLPQTGAVNRVRDVTVALLNSGQVQEGAMRLRPYLEYKLLEVIGRVNIPVPMDFAMDDNKKQVQNCLDAIQAAIVLNRDANRLILTAPQQAGLQTHMASITGNYLSHYATGSTHAFSGPSLLGVVNAIDAYADCFMWEDPAGSGNKRYYRSLSQR